MFGVAIFGGRIERRAARCLSSWTRDYLRAVALADLGCAMVGVFITVWVGSSGNVTPVYLALPALWIAALWLAGAYDARLIGAGSDEYRTVLNAGLSLNAAAAVFLYAIYPGSSRASAVIVLPGVTLSGMVTRPAWRKRLYRRRTVGRCTHGAFSEMDGGTVPRPCPGTPRDRPRPASPPRSWAYHVRASRSL